MDVQRVVPQVSQVSVVTWTYAGQESDNVGT